MPEQLATCWKCGAPGPALDEFTSPYTGLCVACSKARGAEPETAAKPSCTENPKET